MAAFSGRAFSIYAFDVATTVLDATTALGFSAHGDIGVLAPSFSATATLVVSGQGELVVPASLDVAALVALATQVDLGLLPRLDVAPVISFGTEPQFLPYHYSQANKTVGVLIHAE